MVRGRLVRLRLLTAPVLATALGAALAAVPAAAAAVPAPTPVAARPAPAVAAQPVETAQRSVRLAQSGGSEHAVLPLGPPARGRVPAAAPEEQMVTSDGAWCWFGDPRAVRHRGRYDRTYLGWLTRTGEVQIGAYDHATKAFSTATLMRDFQIDDHNNPSIVVRPDGRLMAFWSAHAGPKMYYRVSTRPEDLSSWGPTQTLPVQLAGNSGYTYPNPVFVPSEGNRLYLFWRAWYQPAVSWSDDGGRTWSPARQVLAGAGQRPYVKVALGQDGGLHLAFTDAHPRSTEINDIHYAVLRGGVMRRSDGTPVRALADGPAPPDAYETVYSHRQHGAKAWVHDLTVGPDGRPVVVMATFPTLTDHRYRYARLRADGRWTSTELTNAGPTFERSGKEPHYSGGVTLDHEDPSVVYLSRKSGPTWEIERWRTPDQGATWTRTALTSSSTAPNVRPVSPRGSRGGALDVVWMAGDYAHYASYRTGISTPSDGRAVPRATLAAPARVPYSTRLPLTGQLTDADTGRPLAGVPVSLWVRPMSRQPMWRRATARTDAAGRVRWTVTASRDTEWEMRTAATARRSATTSRSIVVRVTPVPTAVRVSFDQPRVVSGSVVRVSARVVRRADGQPVPGAVVDVYARQGANGVLRGVRRMTSSPVGLVSVAHRPQASTTYVVRVVRTVRTEPSTVSRTLPVSPRPAAR